ncbi:hypothetical protein BC833DRAFT_626700 [Globomyces pollinis-pini]|nr:hypothetical protein BC833DRAFT_626700 [Globomyces pollinis-pini]
MGGKIIWTEQQEFSTTSQLADPQHPRTFIDDMFARYILPFHKDYSDSSSCHTPLSSNPPSRSNSAEDFIFLVSLTGVVKSFPCKREKEQRILSRYIKTK